MRRSRRSRPRAWPPASRRSASACYSQARCGRCSQSERRHPKPEVTLAMVADHIEHIVKVAGIDHVGIGSDFDGLGKDVPVGLEDVSRYPDLLAELMRRGWSDADVAKLAGGNVLRVLDEAEAVSKSMNRRE